MTVGVRPAVPGRRLVRELAPVDVLMVGSYLVASFVLYAGLWADLDQHYLLDSGQDQNLFEWFFAVQAQAPPLGGNPLYSRLQNFPVGVNLMGNTAMPGLAVPLAPVTWMFGPTATWAVILTFGLAATAAAWYWVFSRHLVRHRAAAGVGAAFCAFSPPIITHAHAHPNFTALFVLPLIVLQLIRLHRGRRPVYDGVVLGLLIAWQVLIGEEVLLIAATGLAVYAAGYALARPARLRGALRPLATGLGIAAATSAALVAVPLWWQFFGAASYRALEHGHAGNDLATLGALPDQSLGGYLLGSAGLVANQTEQNAFFGWPMLALLVFTAVWMWRSVQARLATLVALVMVAMSLGGHIHLYGSDTGIVGPWLLFARLPLYESVIEARLTYAAIPAMGALLALGTSRALDAPRRASAPAWIQPRRLWPVALVLAALPILPMPFTVTERAPTPAFFAEGGWREYVRPGRSVLVVPLPDSGNSRPLHWQVEAGLGFPLVEGYFVGPAGPDREGTYGADRRPTAAMLAHVAATGDVPWIGGYHRMHAAADLRFWQADVIVLTAHPHEAALRATLEQLFGPGERRGDVQVWDLRGWDVRGWDVGAG